MKSSVVDNLSLFLQALSLQILFQDYNNSDLMQELQRQDEKYLKTIIKQNEEILNLLRKEEGYASKIGKDN
ncbi:MAG: hypothetical protein IJ690_01870 [Clostridia bacterium]|nr:hypothetical protein [Clostridia bacterium]